MSQIKNRRWDIFCKIVDNYGDIGVCWRLSQQLAHEHLLQVRLFIDDMPAAKKIITALDCATKLQIINGVEICVWPTLENCVDINPADCILETFSCELPDVYIQQILLKNSIWVNLEYLSAENWVSDFHTKPSPHPTLAITKHYFFPGFKIDTGGLIREANLVAERVAFINSQAKQLEFWQKLGISNENNLTENSIKISLFCYPQADIISLIAVLEIVNQPVHLFIPFNSSITIINDASTGTKNKNCNEIHKGNLTIHLLPFLSQADYDHLLWACDLNFVRGEDSWVRAIWAAKPFIWQPYIQTDDTHIKKLKAFLDLYLNAATQEVKSILRESQLAWSKSNPATPVPLTRLINNLPKLRAYAQQETNNLAEQPDLATKLVIFSENLAKNKV
jgi:uncharacterized repeat protein (TIGR03837 family)